MPVSFDTGYTLPGGDEPLDQARICHAGNWLAGGTAGSTATETGYDNQAPMNSLTYDRWKPTVASLPANWTYTHTAPAECDYCFVAAHTLGSSGSRMTVRYDSGGGTYVTIGDFTPTDDSPILFIFEPITATNWRVRVQDFAAEVGIVKFGKALQMPQPIYGSHAPMEFSRVIDLRTNVSETGEWLGRSVQRRAQSTSYQWTHITREWCDDHLPLLQRSVEAEPFLIAWRPSEVATGVAFCTADEPPRASNMGVRDYLQIDLTARGWIDG